jgi:hypothetical protein
LKDLLVRVENQLSSCEVETNPRGSCTWEGFIGICWTPKIVCRLYLENQKRQWSFISRGNTCKKQPICTLLYSLKDLLVRVENQLSSCEVETNPRGSCTWEGFIGICWTPKIVCRLYLGNQKRQWSFINRGNTCKKQPICTLLYSLKDLLVRVENQLSSCEVETNPRGSCTWEGFIGICWTPKIFCRLYLGN